MRRLCVFLPGLVAASPPASLGASFIRLLARARWQPRASSLAQTLLVRSGFSSALPLPIAAVGAGHDLQTTALEPAWRRCDPVHLIADPQRVLLVAPQPGELSAADSSALLTTLQAQLPEFQWRAGASPERWYVRGPELGDLSPYGPAWLNGRSLTPFLPRDPATRAWRCLFNDAQMVLHAAACNAARAASGQTTLNGVWLWGGAPAPTCAPLALTAVGNDLLLAGVVRAQAGRWWADADCAATLALARDAEVLLVVGATWGVATPALPVLDLATFAHEWAPALWRALREGGLGCLELVGEGATGVVTAAARWRFWQRAAAYGPGDPHALAVAAC
ncbi:MAG: hypothetical protein EXR83_09780 [Gammaproteobacteria bacterium]|nr:hypothetical protein [Gammaproteobacteria bacterium]